MDTDYARNGKSILHEECRYWDIKDLTYGGRIGGSDVGPIGGSDGGPIGKLDAIIIGLISFFIVVTIACVASIIICCKKKKKKKRNSVITPETIELSTEVSPMIGEV
ncbi:hypothetical protein AMELA_G00242190 [Ameiurus melas]|uniref:Uncharacterized protein n=1 Tax=Ameiurus melas TaxID=219545 RepID=A0A7J5ZXM7_AMEME|nr:hypothetical protein AMELA_G00242190 [Ameiurus melas]